MQIKLLKEKITTKEAIIRFLGGLTFIFIAICFLLWYQFSEAYFSGRINEWKVVISFICSIYGIKNIVSFATRNMYKIKLQ